MVMAAAWLRSRRGAGVATFDYLPQHLEKRADIKTSEHVGAAISGSEEVDRHLSRIKAVNPIKHTDDLRLMQRMQRTSDKENWQAAADRFDYRNKRSHDDEARSVKHLVRFRAIKRIYNSLVGGCSLRPQ